MITYNLQEIYNEPDIFSLLVHSLCPSIYGHEMIKAGLILGLFGGNNGSNGSPSRSAIHVLVVGDPGLGKSQMLQACARVAVKGVYTCGNSTTSSGLMVTLTKEAGSNDFALEPGALVLADGGCCCIDEFDKMPTHQHSALLECMEQQTVSLAKTGVVCSLPAKAGILAAANPIGGRYDRGKTMLQNLNMSEPLLSRFDLVFLLLDQPDKHLDNLLCKHVMSIHNCRESTQELENITILNKDAGVSARTSLGERLLASLSSKGDADTIPPTILRKYISYAKRYVNPILSEDAAKVLRDYYLEIRAMGKMHQLPVSSRQLEGLIRLTEARAKLELRTEATRNDALDVVQLLRFTTMNSDMTLDLSDVPKHFFPITSSQQSGRSGGGKMRSFLSLLRKISNRTLQRRFTNTELKEIALRSGVVEPEFSKFIAQFNEQGILLKTENDSYKFVSE